MEKSPKLTEEVKLRRLTILSTPTTVLVVVSLRVGEPGMFQTGSPDCRFPASTK